MQEVADLVGIRYERGFAYKLIGLLTPIPTQLEGAAEADAPINWSVRSFDVESVSWRDGLLPNSACEFISRYGVRRYFLHRRRGRLVQLGKREAVYASALIRRTKLAEYDVETGTLSIPFAAPLPEPYAKAACLCSGTPAAAVGGRFAYEGVPADAAAPLLVAAGQPHPLGGVIEARMERAHGQPV